VHDLRVGGWESKDFDLAIWIDAKSLQ